LLQVLVELRVAEVGEGSGIHGVVTNVVGFWPWPDGFEVRFTHQSFWEKRDGDG
jgi:hypothetical protein